MFRVITHRVDGTKVERIERDLPSAARDGAVAIDVHTRRAWMFDAGKARYSGGCGWIVVGYENDSGAIEEV